MSLSIGRYIGLIRRQPNGGRYLAQALQKLQDAVNNLGQNVSADATQTLPAPNSIQGLTVKTNGTGLVHVTVNDQTEIRRGIHYFVEMANEPSFAQPHVVHLGTSRSMLPVVLPSTDDTGKPQSWYFRGYSQLPGSSPSAPIRFGGEIATAVNVGGTQQMTLLASTGSGTAPANGQAAGQGFGKVLIRPGSPVVKKV